APWKFYSLLPLMEAGALHHFAQPFRGSWDRMRVRGWRGARSVPRQWTPRPGGSSVKIAQHRSAAGRPTTRPAGAAAAAGGVATVVGAAARTGTAAARAAGQRAATGGGAPSSGHSRRQPGGAGAPAGWQSVNVAR